MANPAASVALHAAHLQAVGLVEDDLCLESVGWVVKLGQHAAVNPHQKQDSQREAEEFLCLTKKCCLGKCFFLSSSVCT